MPADTEVVISGLGILSPIGAGPEAFWAALAAGRCGIRPISRFDISWLPVRVAAEIPQYDPFLLVSPKEKNGLGPTALVAQVSGRMALLDAGLPADAPRSGRAMDYIYASSSGLIQEYHAVCKKNASSCASPDLRVLRDYTLESVCTRTADRLGLTGWRSVVMNSCASAACGLALAEDRIRLGLAEQVLVAGVDLLNESFFSGFANLRSLAPEVCQPFDAGRKGLVLGETAVTILVESRASLFRRKGKAWARLAGSGMSADAHHLTQPQPEGQGCQRAMRCALAAAGSPQTVGFVSAHGSGTPSNDLTEARAIREVFGGHRLPVTAFKSMLGHAMGAAGATEAAAAILSMHHGLVPPIANFQTLDPACDLDPVFGAARPVQAQSCICNSIGFGGTNASLIFSREEDGR